MRPTSTDGVVLVYNMAVLLSAGYTTMRLNIDDQWTLIGLAVLFGIFWTVYFRISMLPRLIEQADVTDDSEETNASDRLL